MWDNSEDFDKTLTKYSEFSRPLKDKDVEIPPTIIEYRKRIELNTLSPNRRNNINENLTYIASGRGRGIKDRIVKPGYAVEHHPLDDVELKKSIREVAGLGYSNELIEKSMKVQVDDRPNETKQSLEFPFQWKSKSRFMNSQSSSADESSSATSNGDDLPKNRIKKTKCDENLSN